MKIKYFLLLSIFFSSKQNTEDTSTITPSSNDWFKWLIKKTEDTISTLTEEKDNIWNLYYNAKMQLSNLNTLKGTTEEEESTRNKFCIQACLSPEACAAFFSYLHERDTFDNETYTSQKKNLKLYREYIDTIKTEMNYHDKKHTELSAALEQERIFYTVLLQKHTAIREQNKTKQEFPPLNPTEASNQSLSDKLKNNLEPEENNSDTTISEGTDNKKEDFEN
jgi:hypothetical protein